MADTENETRDPNGPPEGADHLMKMAIITATAMGAVYVSVRFSDVSEIPLFVALAATFGVWVKIAREKMRVPSKDCPRLVAQPFAATCAALFLTGAIPLPDTERHSILREVVVPVTLWICLALIVLGTVWWNGLLILRDIRKEFE